MKNWRMRGVRRIFSKAFAGCNHTNWRRHPLHRPSPRQAGLRLEVRNLLAEPWTPERLRPFFGDRPVADWLNLTAPRVKSGEIDPESLSEAEALHLLIEDPIPIRRPLGERLDQRKLSR